MALSTDQKIALVGVLVTGVSVVFAFLAAKYGRDAVREGHQALLVARDSSREARSARRFERLERLLGPLEALQRAAATAQGKPGEVEPVGQARKLLLEELKPFSKEDLPHSFAATEHSDLQLQEIITSCDAARREVVAALDHERRELARLAASS